MTEETQNYVTSIQEVDLKRRRIYVNYEPAFVLYKERCIYIFF